MIMTVRTQNASVTRQSCGSGFKVSRKNTSSYGGPRNVRLHLKPSLSAPVQHFCVFKKTEHIIHHAIRLHFHPLTGALKLKGVKDSKIKKKSKSPPPLPPPRTTPIPLAPTSPQPMRRLSLHRQLSGPEISRRRGPADFQRRPSTLGRSKRRADSCWYGSREG